MNAVLQILAALVLVLTGVASMSYKGNGEDWFFVTFGIGCWLAAGGILAVCLTGF